ncbi:unnamed protein product [Phytophthora fragariaefolia]|uniref:Unnamed protein product n=1 Tax=Phytophthora fragariaefolia TaxID=1490495 RepID=A0A9W6TTX9_9STRA|nr:unnamed protein product [Phytophthora fragariaefolia]
MMSSRQSALKPPAAVKQAIANFQSAGQFKVTPHESETSYMFKWGVRVEFHDDNGVLITRWASLADESCRNSGKNLF